MRRRLGGKHFQSPSALHERQCSQVTTIQFQQIEGTQRRRRSPFPYRIKIRPTLAIERGELAVDDDTARRNAGRFVNPTAAPGDIVSVFLKHDDLAPHLVQLHAPPIKLHFMQPAVAVRWRCAQARHSRRDECGWHHLSCAQCRKHLMQHANISGKLQSPLSPWCSPVPH